MTNRRGKTDLQFTNPSSLSCAPGLSAGRSLAGRPRPAHRTRPAAVRPRVWRAWSARSARRATAGALACSASVYGSSLCSSNAARPATKPSGTAAAEKAARRLAVGKRNIRSMRRGAATSSPRASLSAMKAALAADCRLAASRVQEAGVTSAAPARRPWNIPCAARSRRCTARRAARAGARPPHRNSNGPAPAARTVATWRPCRPSSAAQRSSSAAAAAAPGTRRRRPPSRRAAQDTHTQRGVGPRRPRRSLGQR